MSEVRSLNEFAKYKKAYAYFENQVMWATMNQDYKKAEHYLEVIYSLRRAHKDFCSGELQGIVGERSDIVIFDEMVTVSPKEIDPLQLILFAMGVLAGNPLPIFDSSDHYSI